jgi:hypothetical protein
MPAIAGGGPVRSEIRLVVGEVFPAFSSCVMMGRRRRFGRTVTAATTATATATEATEAIVCNLG